VKHLRTLEYIQAVGRCGSIRKAAEQMNITPSALTRQVQDFEIELGVPIFERLPHGMRLNAAGELLVRHIRTQMSDFERFRSQIADLSGSRRGHITIACSQGFVDHVLTREVEIYRRQFPLVSFSVQVRDHAQGVAALTDYEADLALLLEPPAAPELDVLFTATQPLCALMSRDHPLAATEGSVRLRDCLAYPIAMPDRSLAIRHFLDAALARMQRRGNAALETNSLELLRNYTLTEPGVLSFQISLGVPRSIPHLEVRPIDERDLPPLRIVLAQMRGRRLPVSSAKFADQLARGLAGL
jgi:DNA-binding transcriptional LysR family regulator